MAAKATADWTANGLPLASTGRSISALNPQKQNTPSLSAAEETNVNGKNLPKVSTTADGCRVLALRHSVHRCRPLTFEAVKSSSVSSPGSTMTPGWRSVVFERARPRQVVESPFSIVTQSAPMPAAPPTEAGSICAAGRSQPVNPWSIAARPSTVQSADFDETISKWSGAFVRVAAAYGTRIWLMSGSQIGA